VEKMVKWAKFFLAGISAAAVSYVVNSALGYFFRNLYDPASGVWRAMMTPMWFQNVILANLLAGFLLVIGYLAFNRALGSKSETTKKGLKYGFFIWLVKDVIGFTMTYVLIYVSGALIATWLLAGLIINLLNGLIIAKIYK
jgi:hypothetical protein